MTPSLEQRIPSLRPVLLAAVLMLSCALTACGGDDNSSSSPTAPAPASGASGDGAAGAPQPTTGPASGTDAASAPTGGKAGLRCAP